MFSAEELHQLYSQTLFDVNGEQARPWGTAPTVVKEIYGRFAELINARIKPSPNAQLEAVKGWISTAIESVPLIPDTEFNAGYITAATELYNLLGGQEQFADQDITEIMIKVVSWLDARDETT